MAPLITPQRVRLSLKQKTKIIEDSLMHGFDKKTFCVRNVTKLTQN